MKQAKRLTQAEYKLLSAIVDSLLDVSDPNPIKDEAFQGAGFVGYARCGLVCRHYLCVLVRTRVVKPFISHQDIIHFIYIILPLKEQFERDPYGLTQTELNMLNAHHRRSIQRWKQD